MMCEAEKVEFIHEVGFTRAWGDFNKISEQIKNFFLDRNLKVGTDYVYSSNRDFNENGKFMIELAFKFVDLNHAIEFKLLFS